MNCSLKIKCSQIRDSIIHMSLLLNIFTVDKTLNVWLVSKTLDHSSVNCTKQQFIHGGHCSFIDTYAIVMPSLQKSFPVQIAISDSPSTNLYIPCLFTVQNEVHQKHISTADTSTAGKRIQK